MLLKVNKQLYFRLEVCPISYGNFLSRYLALAKYRYLVFLS